MVSLAGFARRAHYRRVVAQVHGFRGVVPPPLTSAPYNGRDVGWPITKRDLLIWLLVTPALLFFVLLAWSSIPRLWPPPAHLNPKAEDIHSAATMLRAGLVCIVLSTVAAMVASAKLLPRYVIVVACAPPVLSAAILFLARVF